MINGVKIKNLKVLPDERDRVMEILRRDDSLFKQPDEFRVDPHSRKIPYAWERKDK